MMMRPLGFGEIFDRAITIYIKNLLPFVGIVLVLLVPGAVLQFMLGSTQAEQLAQVWQMIQHPGQTPPAAMSTLPYSGPVLALVFIFGFIALLMEPFVFNAVAIGVARIYRGQHVEFRACYAQVFRRFAPVLGLLVLEFLLLILWEVAFFVLAFILIFFAAMLYALSHALSIIVGILAGLILLATLLLLAPLAVVLVFAMYEVVIEDRGAIASISLAFSRIFSRNEFWRAMLIAICGLLIALTASSIFSGIAIVALFFKQVWLYVLLNSIANGLISPFSIVLFAVYYFDVLVRRGEIPASERPVV